MKITYSNEVLDAYSGQINCEAGIFVDGEIVGVAQYILYDNELTISDIFVRPEFRRQGFGSRLMKYIQQENPDYHYKPSLKTELGAKFVHKEIGLDEGMIDILKGKSHEEAWAQLPWKVKDFWKKLKQDFPNAKFHWSNNKIRIYQEYGVFQIFYHRLAYYIAFTKQHWSGVDVFNIWMRSPENRNDFMVAGHVRSYEEFKKDLMKLDKEFNEDTEDYGDVPADYVQESVSDVLKPKDPQSIMSHFKQKYNFNVLQTEFLTYPYLDEYFKDFYFERDLYVKDPKWSKYATPDYLQSKSLPGGYQTIDITKEAKETIIESTKNIKTKRPLKALQFNWANFGDLDSLRRFFNDLNLKNGVRGDNPLWKHFGDNDAFKWAYYGEEYSYLGNSDGFALFIVPDDFIKKFFGVNESISDILKPKSIEDIKQSVIELVENLEETQNVAEFIDQTIDEDPDVCQELEDLCASMGSDPGNVEFIIEESKGYEEIQKITNIIDEKSNSKRNMIGRAEHPLTYENMSYRINPVAKLAWGYPNDFNGMNIIFFDYPKLLRSIKKVEFAWEKYQI